LPDSSAPATLPGLGDLDNLYSQVRSWFARKALASFLGAGGADIERISLDWLAKSGKRWRPYLVVVVYRACCSGPEAPLPEEVRSLAVAVECIHKASLIYDDIQDDDSLRYGRKDVQQMRGEYDQRRHVTLKRLGEMGLSCFKPRGAFYVFPSIAATGLSSAEFAERLLFEEKVAVVPGNAFGAGGEGHVRICYATAMDQLEEALARMARFVARQH
jgi:geranylgeranyl pyrophosphate synthase